MGKRKAHKEELVVHQMKNRRGDVYRMSFKKGIKLAQFESALEGKNFENIAELYDQVTGKKAKTTNGNPGTQ